MVYKHKTQPFNVNKYIWCQEMPPLTVMVKKMISHGLLSTKNQCVRALNKHTKCVFNLCFHLYAGSVHGHF